jgi:thioredoxin reductase
MPSTEPALEFSEDLPETPDLHGAYPRLDDARIAALSALGQRRATRPGDILFREGDRNCDFSSSWPGKWLPSRATGRRRGTSSASTVTAEATSIARVDGQCTVRVGDETSVTAPMVVIDTGARYRLLEVPRTEYFEKVSVYYAASQAEAQLCRGDPVVIVGGGNFAGQAAVFLARHAARVALVVREQDLGEARHLRRG